MIGDRTMRRAREIACVLTLVALLALATSAWGQAGRGGGGGGGGGGAVEAPADSASIERTIVIAREAVNDKVRRVALQPLAQSVGGRVALLKLMIDGNEAMRRAAMTVMAQDYHGTEKCLRDDAYKDVLPAALAQLVEEACMPRASPFNQPWVVLREQIGPGADVTPGIIKNLVSDDAKRRLAGADLLELCVHSKEVREAVAKTLGDGDRNVRDIAGRWLMQDGPAGRAALMEAMKSPNPAIRAMAVNYVDGGGAKLSTDLITLMGDLMMHDPDGDVRSRAVDRLRSNGSKEAIGAFIEAIRNGSDEVRRLAAGRMLGGQEAAAALLPLLDEKNPAVRAAALRALGDHGRRQYMPLEKVVRLLDDSDIEISKAAALALQEWEHRGPVSARQIGSLRLVTDRHGSRTEYDRDRPAEPPAPAWRMPEVQSTSSAAGSVNSGGGATAAGSMLMVLTLALLGVFGVLAVVRRAGLIADDGRSGRGLN
jgi:hypothetical protein